MREQLWRESITAPLNEGTHISVLYSSHNYSSSILKLAKITAMRVWLAGKVKALEKKKFDLGNVDYHLHSTYFHDLSHTC